MKKEYLTILTNIIGGVESGGQTYGKRKYGAYAGKAANADNEKTCQDDLFKELMEKYIAEAEAYGVDNIQAQVMWCEIEHLGGSKPVKRIFARAKKPYTPDTVYASLILDQKDTSNDNQVGDKKFESRHQCCVRWIKQYVVDNVDKSGGRRCKNVFKTGCCGSGRKLDRKK